MLVIFKAKNLVMMLFHIATVLWNIHLVILLYSIKKL